MNAGVITDDEHDRIVVTPETVWVFAVTSANHDATRRNPVALQHRVTQAELFIRDVGLRGVVVTVPDVPQTSRFAKRVLGDVAEQVGVMLTPADTLVAVSTGVADMYQRLGFRVGRIELDGPVNTPYAWDVVSAVVARRDDQVNEWAHPSTLDVWARYGIREKIRDVFADVIVSGENGGLTGMRAYGTYAQAFEENAARKWEEIRHWVQPGRVLDVGCATGQMLVEAGRDPALRGSELIGLEPDRWLHADAKHRLAQGQFTNPQTFFHRRNVLTGTPYPTGSVTTTITAALTHEIYSYGNGDTDLAKLSRRIWDHTAAGGVWINSDVAAPDNPDEHVLLWLNPNDGDNIHITDPQTLKQTDLAFGLNQQSTQARFTQWVTDNAQLRNNVINYIEHDAHTVQLRMADAMEFLLHKDYTDNWLSEMCETFTYRTWDMWQTVLMTAGWEILPGSGAYTNTWITENRFAGHARLTNMTGMALGWPVTHVRFAARKPGPDSAAVSH